MSDVALARRRTRRRVAALGLTVIAGGCWTAAWAQSAAARADSLRLGRASLQALAVAFTAARQEADRSDSLARYRLPRDTVRVGGLVFRVMPAYAPLARNTGTISWEQLDGMFGDAALSLSSHVFVLRDGMTEINRSQGTRTPTVELAEVVDGVISPKHRESVNIAPADLANRVTRLATAELRARQDVALREWLNPMLNPSSPAWADRERTYIELVTADARVSERCFVGDLLRCRQALLITPVADTLSELYDAAGWRRLVQQREGSLRSGRTVPDFDRCVNDSDFQECLALLRHSGVPVAPLGGAARHSLVRTALAAGGRGAYARLTSSSGKPIAERLALTAGVPVDSLVSMWRSAVLAARPVRTGVLPGEAWLAVFWATVLGLVSFGSTRWR